MKHRFSYILVVWLLFFLLAGKKATAQVSAIVDLSKRSVYVQQPFRVNITVYTKTWFTAPLEFNNLQIPNAFIVPFDKTQPGMFTIGGKQYPGVQFYYIVFPYKAGEFSIPSLDITVQSPPEGSSTGIKQTIHTTVEKFSVRDIPKDKQTGFWLVAKDVIITEKWNADLDHLKVGDVLVRTIVITAKGTLPQFIPNLSGQQQIKWASIYPKDPVLNEFKEGGDVSGKSSQTITYLLEKSGNFTLPAVQLSFWNPFTGKMQERVLPEKKFSIAENPDLGILSTLRDSLASEMGKPESQNAKKGPYTLLGLPWYTFAGISVVVLVLIYLLVHFSTRGYHKFKTHQARYKQTEKYLFKRFLQSDEAHLSETLYKWWDALEHKPSASVGFSFDSLGKHQAATDLRDLLTTYYHTGKISPDDFKKQMKQLRREVLSMKPQQMIGEEQGVYLEKIQVN